MKIITRFPFYAFSIYPASQRKAISVYGESHLYIIVKDNISAYSFIKAMFRIG
jgi:hypothetical protein